MSGRKPRLACDPLTASNQRLPALELDIVIDCYKEREATHGWGKSLDLTLQVLSETEWAQLFTDAGFSHVETKRVIDSRGPGDEADFTPNETYPDFATRAAFHEAGSLWIHAVR